MLSNYPNTQQVDGFSFHISAVQVNFADNTRPIMLPICLIKDVVADKDGMVDLGFSHVDENGAMTTVESKVTFDYYLQHYFEDEAVPVLANIIEQLKLKTL